MFAEYVTKFPNKARRLARKALGIQSPKPSIPTIINPRLKVLSFAAKGGDIVEIGVLKGAYSERILKVARPRKLHLVDPWKVFEDETYDKSLYGKGKEQAELDQRYETVCNRFQTEIADGVVEIHRKLSGEAGEQFADGSLDFVYIDGDHTYEGVTADIKTYWPKLKIGGMLAGDDYNLGGWWGDGVVRAINELLAQTDAIVEWKDGNQILVRKL